MHHIHRPLQKLCKTSLISIHHTTMLRERSKRKHRITKRIRYPVTINSKAIHISIRRYGERFYIKRLLWCQFIPETTWYALPLNYLDSKSQEQWKEFLNQTDILEFPAGSITSDRRSQEYIHQNFK